VTHPDRVEDYLEHIVQAVRRATRYIQHLDSPAALRQNEQTQDAVVRNIEIIGEAASRIQSIAPEFVVSHPELPWIEMRGMRNKMIPEYFDVDWALSGARSKTIYRRWRSRSKDC
jgi:uncharacterized protein with HEPN domain